MAVILLDLARLLNRWRDFVPAPVIAGLRKRLGAGILLLLAGSARLRHLGPARRS